MSWEEPASYREPPEWAAITRTGERTTVTCGDCDPIDADQVHELHRLLVGMMESQTTTIELDLRYIRTADTKLAAALVLAARLARKCGVDLVIHTAGHMQGVIEICGLAGILTAG